MTEESILTSFATDILVRVCSKMPLLYLLTQKVAQKFGYVLGIKGKIKTITTDTGVEFAAHEIISKSLGVPVYFADPYYSWQKGAIENANGLVRQYILCLVVSEFYYTFATEYIFYINL